jgi:hypothetical protein
MSLTNLANLVARPSRHQSRASRLTESLSLPVTALPAEVGKPLLLVVPFPALKSSGLQVVEAIAPATKVLTGKDDAVANAENRVSKALGEKASLVGLDPSTGGVVFQVSE